MPNWCDNTLIVTGSNDRVKQFYDQNIQEGNIEEGEETIFNFNNLRPCPNEDDWYNWRITNWGTKWNGIIHNTEIADNKLVIDFNSAWSPPEQWVRYVAENHYPDLHFHLSFLETGAGFCGVLEGQGTEIFSDATKPIEEDEEGNKVRYSAKDERYKYVETGKIIEDEDFMPIYINPLI